MSRPSRPSPVIRCRQGWVVVPLFCCLLSLLPTTVTANEGQAQKTRADLQQLRQRIERVRKEVAKTRDKYERQHSKLRDIELRISKHVRELKYIRFRLKQQDRRLGQLYHDRKNHQQDLHKQQELLGQQLHTAYVMGQQAYLKLLLSQDDPAAAGRTLRYYNYFHKHRTELIQQTSTALARLEQNQRDIEREKRRLSDLRSYSQRKKQQLEQDSGQRRSMLVQLNRQLQDKTESLKRMLADEQQLQKLIKGIQRVMPELTALNHKQQAFDKLKGKLSWPAAGSIKRLFGRKRGTSQATWNGIIIRARQGNNVHAISHGRVAYADWLRGYGLLLIIDHGGGYMSLYGHNQSLLKETGDWVEAGENIATIGNRSGHSDSGLYFEIRHKGKPRNPVQWCRKTRRS